MSSSFAASKQCPRSRRNETSLRPRINPYFSLSLTETSTGDDDFGGLSEITLDDHQDDCSSEVVECAVFTQKDLAFVAMPVMEDIRRDGKLCDVTIKVCIRKARMNPLSLFIALWSFRGYFVLCAKLEMLTSITAQLRQHLDVWSRPQQRLDESSHSLMRHEYNS